MCFYSQITNYKGNYARDTSISPVSRSYSSTRWSSRRVPGNPSRSLARTDYFPIDRLICELIVQLSVSIYTCSTVWCTATSVFEPCKATFVLVARYRRRVYVYVRAYVLEAARYASDNGVASRQRKSSHEKCTPSPSKPPDNKVEREENRLFSFLFHLSPPLSLSLSLSVSRCLHNLAPTVATTGVRRSTKFFDCPAHLEREGNRATLSWNHRVFWRRYSSTGINSPTSPTYHLPRSRMLSCVMSIVFAENRDWPNGA